ncbi:hypothetical protein GCM10010123_45890 [Pilimelia anulata]|uniref:DUF4326 domain-containing protein n=1 Tax=Pilimelia anulata TaxID=53371 RepID=A0A8J3BIE5_9ACTN|nr:DUF4326 domain-containing protein [Pilimelia anulata]GGK10751.1 hypothetical protein GCM10010123_45890 [Pilimelia anulata]
MSPARVQMSRRTPWRPQHPDAVRVDRATRWGNPFPVDQHGRAEAIARYRAALLAGELAVTVDDVRTHLAGRDLACWCPLVDADGHPVPCHADVLMEVAAAPAAP